MPNFVDFVLVHLDSHDGLPHNWNRPMQKPACRETYMVGIG